MVSEFNLCSAERDKGTLGAGSTHPSTPIMLATLPFLNARLMSSEPSASWNVCAPYVNQSMKRDALPPVRDAAPTSVYLLMRICAMSICSSVSLHDAPQTDAAIEAKGKTYRTRQVLVRKSGPSSYPALTGHLTYADLHTN